MIPCGDYLWLGEPGELAKGRLHRQICHCQGLSFYVGWFVHKNLHINKQTIKLIKILPNRDYG